MSYDDIINSGLPGLDSILHGLRLEDNVIWRIDNVEAYAYYAQKLAEQAIAEKRTLVYFRFASHAPVVPRMPGCRQVQLDPAKGFEDFITQIHAIIKECGWHTVCIFDCISELTQAWYNDRAVGNFYKLTCPYLYKKEDLAYFAVYRNHHSYHAVSPISETAQVLIDAYESSDNRYLIPRKVEGRTSATMFLTHEQNGDQFLPITESVLTSEVLNISPWTGLHTASYRMMGVWDRTFIHAEQVLKQIQAGECPPEQGDIEFDKIVRLIISRDEPILKLVKKYFSLADLLHIWKRMIGTGMIGGKAIGMLLARGILIREDEIWRQRLEHHDSFFIGADVFYTYLIENDCWWSRQRQKNPETFLDNNDAVRERLLAGIFPDYIINRFSDLLDYYGRAPIIIRSSSLLEDNFGNAFAGKYESVFCPNQGTKEDNLKNVLDAVRIVYASTMSDEALKYRQNRGVLDRDEQMALLVQRVSGQQSGDYFFPQLAGVGFSFNPYAWSKDIDPESGMVRLVFGLGTRAVDRADDDYTRVVALNAPEKRPEANFDDVSRYSQRRVDVINLQADAFQGREVSAVLPYCKNIPVSRFTIQDRSIPRGEARRSLKNQLLTFDPMLKDSEFVTQMKEMLMTLRRVYKRHVDIEFTANFNQEGQLHFNLVQCRPLQVKVNTMIVPDEPNLEDEQIIIQTSGAVIGHSRLQPLDQLIYIVPEEYGALSQQKRYDVARAIGNLMHAQEGETKTIMLIGPGRWGTSTPALGVPVTFNDIDPVTVLCEMDIMHEGLVPDLSLGTHFFNEMVESDMLYLALFMERSGCICNKAFFMEAPNHLRSYLPDAEVWQSMIKVIEPEPDQKLYVYADSVKQKAYVYK